VEDPTVSTATAPPTETSGSTPETSPADGIDWIQSRTGDWAFSLGAILLALALILLGLWLTSYSYGPRPAF
jgi:flagellar biogenesis protein FliO